MNPMKKNYIQPATTLVLAQHGTPLAISGVGSSDLGIGYGGVDDDGSLDADVKANPFGDSIFE